jgi:hypothetical protein
MSSTPMMPFQQNENSASHRIWRHDIFDSSPSSKEEIPRSSHQTVVDGFDRPTRPLKKLLARKLTYDNFGVTFKTCSPTR